MTTPILTITVLGTVGLAALWGVFLALKAGHARTSPPHGATETVRHRSWRHIVLGLVGRAFRLMLRLGMPLGPMMLLTVRGRRSGLPRTNPVDVFGRGDREWLVATHDAGADWVHNLRAAGQATLTRGRRSRRFTAVELSQTEAGAVLDQVLRPRLARPLAGSVLRQTLGATAATSPAEFVEIAANHPVFKITPVVADTSTAIADRRAPEARMTTRSHIARALIVFGLASALLHIVGFLGGALTADRTVTGAIIGLLTAGGGNHLRLDTRHRSPG